MSLEWIAFGDILGVGTEEEAGLEDNGWVSDFSKWWMTASLPDIGNNEDKQGL